MQNPLKHELATKSTLAFIVNTINYNSRERRFIIEGSLSDNRPLSGAEELVPYLNDKRLDCSISKELSVSSDELKHWYAFTLPLENYGKITLRIVRGVGDGESASLPIEYNQLSNLSGKYAAEYRLVRNHLFLPAKTSLIIKPFSIKNVFVREVRFFIENLKSKEQIENNVAKSMLIGTLRLSAVCRIRFKRAPRVWLFSDRAISGGDNSEVLFRYIADRGEKDVAPYFVVNADTPTYQRLKRHGYNVVKFRSVKHLYLAMIAELLLPSHLDIMYLYPWPGIWWKYSGLMQNSIIHTQHGIVLNDIADYVGKRRKNPQLFLSICDWEKRHLISERYGYDSSETPVTGAPRYDELDGKSTKRVISIHPTWRSWLAGKENRGTKEYAEKFSGSGYHMFYQALLNDKRILSALNKHDYTLRFYLHPNHQSNSADFTSKDQRVELMEFPYDYSAMINESAVFVTDYSNTLFDFAYLKKPIIHTQFDSKAFFLNQAGVGEQLFDYEREGFGPVCRDYESTVQEIVGLIVNDTTGMQQKYEQRVNEFFTYTDRNNCARAHDAIAAYLRM